MAEKLDRSSLAGARTALIYEGWVARTHLPDESFPLEYVSGPEWRDDAELRRILDQVRTIQVPTTFQHPMGLLPGAAVKSGDGRIIGAVVGGRMDGEHVVAQIAIWDQDAIREINNGTVELSLGYQCHLDEQRFQRDILLNHLSVVPAGRCLTCELNPERADQRCDSAPLFRHDRGGTLVAVASPGPTATPPEPMKLAPLTVELGLKLDDESKAMLARMEKLGVTVDDLKAPAPEEKSDAAAGHAGCACNSRAMPHNAVESTNMDLEQQLAEAKKNLEAAQAQVAALTEEVTSLKADAEKKADEHKLALDSATADLKAETARADKAGEDLKAKDAEVEAAKTARSDAEDAEFAKRVDARVELLANAEIVGVEDAKSKTDREVKVAIIAKVDEIDVEEKASAEYVNGMYFGALKRFAKASKSLAEVRETITENRDDVTTEEIDHDPRKAEQDLRDRAAARRNESFKAATKKI